MSPPLPATDYRTLVTQWQPTSSRDRSFKIFLVIFLIIVVTVINVLSSVDVPEPARVTRADTPERVVRFIVDQTKPPPTREPEAEPLPKPAPIVVPQPVVERKERERPAEPLTDAEKRARRQTPGLQGRLVVEITIASTGQVTEVDMVSSDLNNPIFEQRIVSRILLFEFDATASESITVIYPIEFLPT
ncbi:AgmX/PglI C-terminal domain-containing protein [Marinimicrobium sp. ARAG 43.8]|uniref:AgmX/PglI C-terminal domain-containing protein n=1 Tax=Marinimicrobium sp. ARAG 43.8 TaxID=3418719 RepID=UPI003CF1D184